MGPPACDSACPGVSHVSKGGMRSGTRVLPKMCSRYSNSPWDGRSATFRHILEVYLRLERDAEGVKGVDDARRVGLRRVALRRRRSGCSCATTSSTRSQSCS